MFRQKLLVSIGLSIFVLLLLLVAMLWLRSKQSSRKAVSRLNSSPTSLKNAKSIHAGLSLNPSTQILRPQQQFEVGVIMDNEESPISGVSLKILFDKRMIVMSLPQVESYFPNPVVFENSIDDKLGIISISLGSITPATGSGTLVKLSGIINSGVSGETDLVILPESKIMRQGSTASILTSTNHATLNVVLY